MRKATFPLEWLVYENILQSLEENKNDKLLISKDSYKNVTYSKTIIIYLQSYSMFLKILLRVNCKYVKMQYQCMMVQFKSIFFKIQIRDMMLTFAKFVKTMPLTLICTVIIADQKDVPSM